MKLQQAGLWKDFLADRESLGPLQKPSEAPERGLREFIPKCEKLPTAPPVPLGADRPPREFFAKECSETETIRWVTANVDNPYATFADAPSPTALTLLSMCRESAGFKADFFNNQWTKLIPARSSFDSGDRGKGVDGTVEIELIGRILGISDAAKKGAA